MQEKASWPSSILITLLEAGVYEAFTWTSPGTPTPVPENVWKHSRMPRTTESIIPSRLTTFLTDILSWSHLRARPWSSVDDLPLWGRVV